MFRTLAGSAALVLAAISGGASAQEGAKFDCPFAASAPAFRASLGEAMVGQGDPAVRSALVEQLRKTVDGCVASQGVAEAQKADYFDYSLARISREWLIGAIARANLKTEIVDKALDFGPGRANPDLSGDMTEDQIVLIVQGYVNAGVDIEKVDQSVWEKVGAYAAATSIYWNKRQRLPF
ncbi:MULTISPECIES: hypothetical protein [unclassified Sphingopyxis]|uniref:hypothetical protein n=1 Tax=unclassified Sphingopyxis TaxID=2614943 RepID=UPI0024AD7070|nr:MULTISPECIES: hypothetical protein [unclassified Sphingopyxis]